MLGKWNQTSPGGDWAMFDPEIIRLHPGKFVVAVPNQIIVVGDDEKKVRAEGAEKLNLPLNDVMVAFIAPAETRPAFDWF